MGTLHAQYAGNAPYVRERRPGEPTRRERRARPSVGTNQPRPIRVVNFDGEPCKWPQMGHVTMGRVTRRCLRA